MKHLKSFKIFDSFVCTPTVEKYAYIEDYFLDFIDYSEEDWKIMVLPHLSKSIVVVFRKDKATSDSETHYFNSVNPIDGKLSDLEIVLKDCIERLISSNGDFTKYQILKEYDRFKRESVGYQVILSTSDVIHMTISSAFPI